MLFRRLDYENIIDTARWKELQLARLDSPILDVGVGALPLGPANPQDLATSLSNIRSYAIGLSLQPELLRHSGASIAASSFSSLSWLSGASRCGDTPCYGCRFVGLALGLYSGCGGSAGSDDSEGADTALRRLLSSSAMAMRETNDAAACCFLAKMPRLAGASCPR